MNIKILTITVFIAVVGVCIFLWRYDLNDNNAPQSVIATSSPQSSEQYVGNISTTTSGQNVYTSAKYGLQFTYPLGWRVGDNHLGYGTLQLLNYDSSETGKSVFLEGENKIEASVVAGTPEEVVSKINKDPTADYPIINFTNTRLEIAAQDAIRTEVDLLGGQKYITYRIPLKTTPNEFLGITMYGDSSNFSVLDQIVQSIRWTR